MKLLIVGDSFSADWTTKYAGAVGWPLMLAQVYDTDNLSQAGCSEYKIRKQLDQADLTQYSHCIVVHTSPWRLPVEHNPLHNHDQLHHSCDFIFSDVEASRDPSVKCVRDYFKYYFHREFYQYVHDLLIKDINNHLKKFKIKYLHVTFFDLDLELINVNYYQLFQKQPGLINHLDDDANKQVAGDFINWIEHA